MRVTRRQVVQGAGVAGLGLLAGCGRLPGQGQPPARLARIGYLSIGDRDSTLRAGRLDAFLEGLRDLGYVEGQNVTVETRFAESNAARLADFAAELVHLPVDVLVAVSTVAALAAKQATAELPIVASSGDAVGTGLVASLARPGGNVTGLTEFSPQLSSKRLELLRDVVPNLSRVAVLWYAEGPAPALALIETERAAQALGVRIQSLGVRSAADFEAAFDTIAREGANGLIPLQGPVVNDQVPRVVEFAAKMRLPAMYTARGAVAGGGLMGYAAATGFQDRRIAYYVVRILKGATPADLPIEQPREFDFVINLKTAQALGLTIPQSVLLQATEVIQ